MTTIENMSEILRQTNSRLSELRAVLAEIVTQAEADLEWQTRHAIQNPVTVSVRIRVQDLARLAALVHLLPTGKEKED